MEVVVRAGGEIRGLGTLRRRCGDQAADPCRPAPGRPLPGSFLSSATLICRTSALSGPGAGLAVACSHLPTLNLRRVP